MLSFYTNSKVVAISDYELERFCDRKSFYRKCQIFYTESGEQFLKSYDTIVCYVDGNRNFHRVYPGYSATTMRHVNAFLKATGIPGGGKAWWNNQKVEFWYDFQFVD